VIGDLRQGFGVQALGDLMGYIGAKFFIRCRQAPNFVVDSASKQRQGGGDTLLWSDTRNNNPNQIWTLDAYGHIVSAENPSMALVAASCSEGAHVTVCNLSAPGVMTNLLGRWSMNSYGEISSQANPDLLLNVCGGQLKDGPALILWRRQGADAKNDKWMIEVLGQQGRAMQPNIGELRYFVGSRFFIRCMSQPNFVVDSASKQRQGGGDTLLWSDTRNKNPNQIWTLDAYGHIVSAENPSMALVPASCSEGAHVTVCNLSSVSSDPRSMWTMNSYGEIVTQANPDLLLNVCGGQLKDGPALILWRRQGADAKNDKWRLDRA